MTYRLYGDRGSGSAIIELALAEIGLTLELSPVPLEEDAQRLDAFAALNPQRKLPVLVTPKGEILTESAAILLALADRYPAAKLLPEIATERALAQRWLLFMASELYPLIEIHDYPERFEPAGARASAGRLQALVDHSRSLWQQRWLLVENAVAGRPWFLASGFSAVDIYTAVLSRWGKIDQWRTTALPRVEGIAAALATRRTTAEAWQRHFS